MNSQVEVYQNMPSKYLLQIKLATFLFHSGMVPYSFFTRPVITDMSTKFTIDETGVTG